MTIEATRHSARTLSTFRGEVASVRGGQEAAGVTVTSGTVSSAVGVAGLYRIIAKTECRVRFGPSVTDATGGEYWPAEAMEIVWLNATDKIAVGAA